MSSLPKLPAFCLIRLNLPFCADFCKIRQASNASRTAGGLAFGFKFNSKFRFYRTNLTLPHRLKPRKILNGRVKSRTRIKQIIILKALLQKPPPFSSLYCHRYVWPSISAKLHSGAALRVGRALYL